MLSVGSVIEPYDTDKAFPCFGFGGVPRHMGATYQTSHCFPMNGCEEAPEIYGIENIVETYRKTLPLITLSDSVFIL